MNDISHILYFRPSANPSASVPLGGRSVGHYIVDAKHHEQRMVKDFFQFFWGIEGTGEFKIGRQALLLHPEEVLFLKPGDLHDFQAVTKKWEYRWWTMDGPLTGRIISSFGWKNRGPKRAGPCPVELFIGLENCIRKIGPAAERRGCAAAIELLAAASGDEREEDSFDPLVSECVAIIKRQFKNPGLDVAALAKVLRVHRTTLARKFCAQTGVSPSEYIIRTRVQNAQSLLKGNSRSIAEIAGDCGYEDSNYFSTAFKRMTGLSPKEFRRQ
ncbi:MAG: hypothetical protein A2X49_08885 [Lentisphaerae bacterium GWF2_52_8]|nr:MAG: hypothetical protein A2X49_08885 [Lentisphaerae bacterium GWF2_52_8]